LNGGVRNKKPVFWLFHAVILMVHKMETDGNERGEGNAKSFVCDLNYFSDQRRCDRGRLGGAHKRRRRGQIVRGHEFRDACATLALGQRGALARALPSVQSLALLVGLLTDKQS
jgi:hypothetical protein